MATRSASKSTTRRPKSAATKTVRPSKPTPSRSDAAGRRESDIERQAVLDVVTALYGANTVKDVALAALHAVQQAFGWAYGSFWRIDETDHTLVFAVDTGEVTPEFRAASSKARFKEGQGVNGRAWASRDLFFVEDLGTMVDCPRRESAVAAGVKSGISIPVFVGDQVLGTLDWFALETLRPSEQRLDTLRRLGQIINSAVERVNLTIIAGENAKDAAAVRAVLRATTGKRSIDELAQSALAVVRDAFGWAYGSYWRRDPVRDELVFAVESGSVTSEFRDITLRASFKEGVGLSGRAWRARDLVWVRDLGEVTDCVRAPAAQRAGVKSGVCFPVIVKGEVVGTMDFFALETLALSDSRLEALRDVGRLVSSGADRVQLVEEFERDVKSVVDVVSSSSTELEASATTMAAATEETTRQAQAVSAASEQATRNVQTVAASAEQLMGSIREIAARVHESSSIAQRAVQQAASTSATMVKLGESSQEIGQVVKVITSIAQQTNLLALNATIEAARAGEAGKGFAVVANEVKELARQTARATEEIGARITGVQNDTQAAVRAIEEVGAVIDQINSIATTIAGAVEEQNAATGEISRNVSEAARGTAVVSENIAAVTQVAHDSGRTAEGIRGAAQQLSKEAEGLNRAVDQFLTKMRQG